MATYSPESLKIKAPAGGFQDLGWYSGRQYIGGTLSEPGVIHPSSPQSGAGQAVSKEVVQQTNPANWDYIQSEKTKATATPTTPAELSSTLDKFQATTFASANTSAPKIATMEELKATLAPTAPAPTPLNRVAEYTKLQETYKTADLEKSLNDLKAQEDEAVAALRQQTQAERGKPVAQGVIEGRVSEETRIAQENLDFIGRQKTRVVDELNTKYNIINTYMNLIGLDYNDAVSRYDSDFAKNIQIYGIIQKQGEAALTQHNIEVNNAKANLQIYANAISAGNLNVNSLTGDQKLMLNKLEIQSEMPVGFISNLGMSAKDRLFAVSDDKTQAWVLDENNHMTVVQTGLRAKVGGGTQHEQEKTAVADMARTLRELGGDDYLVSPQEWKDSRGVWISAGLSGEAFDKAFSSQFTDTSKPELYGFRAY